ncbi:hypothetical protein [Micromonospora andamanensis]|uniref:hypothetical protein n=1 Tax=Micromonospora andamanensis TaxID=1287068 RepID=UPI0019509765|nr:hypothetical protein [Micromonospora andamanensis]GIJ37656.1 hypothetical protein Vwe01_09810 [Micromonospora andamanensis]
MDVDAIHRLRGALLVAVGVVALTLGGWWWRVQAPETPGGGVAPGGSSAATYWREDQVTGEIVREFPGVAASVLVDARTGAAAGVGGESRGPADATRPGWSHASGAELVWTERARLSSGVTVVRQTQMASGERHLLRLSCTGPGELLVAVRGARSAAPMTVACDGGLILVEVTGTGAPVRLSFSPAGSDPIQVEARLIALR